MNIWLISIFEQTPIDKVFSTRFISIGNEAVSRGHNVVFFASTFKHNTKNHRFEKTTEVKLNENYSLVFIKSPGYKNNISLKRLIAHYNFSKTALVEMKKREKPDLILMAYPPISLTKSVSKWAKSENIPVILDIIDPWPETFSIVLPKHLRWFGRFLFAPMVNSFRKTLVNVSAVTAISKQYINYATSLYADIPKTKVFYPASDLNLMRSHIKKWQSKEKKDHSVFKIIYAGSLAKSYDIQCILSAAALLSEKFPDIHFTIAGKGPQENIIRDYSKKHKNLIYVGRLNKDELMREYFQSDLGLTQHIKGATQSVTYKLFDLLSAGLPILNSLESEMKDIILENQVGLFNPPGDYKSLANNILFFYYNREKLALFRQNGFKLTKIKGQSDVVYGEFVDLIEEIHLKN